MLLPAVMGWITDPFVDPQPGELEVDALPVRSWLIVELNHAGSLKAGDCSMLINLVFGQSFSSPRTCPKLDIKVQNTITASCALPYFLK